MAKKERITSRSGIVISPFTQMPDHILEDSRLNGNAYRVMNYIMSKPEDWVYYREDIEKRLGFGKDAYYTARKQLYECGYLEYDATNQGTDFIYYERPDKNPYYIDGINKNGNRKIEFSTLLEEIIEKEKSLLVEAKRVEENFQKKIQNLKGSDTKLIQRKTKNGDQKQRKSMNDTIGDFEDLRMFL